ncbi:MAG: DNA recombination protein RmuC [Lawsonella clevelandensis]
MAKHCDFSTQQHVRGENGVQRPDLVVHLSGQRSIIVDAKVPFDSYLTAINATDLTTQQNARQACVRAVRSHIDTLAKKNYWEAFLSSPEFVVMSSPANLFSTQFSKRIPPFGLRILTQCTSQHAHHTHRATPHCRTDMAA